MPKKIDSIIDEEAFLDIFAQDELEDAEKELILNEDYFSSNDFDMSQCYED